MANPKKRHTSAKRDRRRSQWKIVVQSGSKCPKCNAPKMPHCVCPSCGFYKEELVVPKKEKKKNEDSKEQQQHPPEAEK
ncbi:MAG: 50S ribosomal protein L32 [Elusimicrobiota bacterium]